MNYLENNMKFFNIDLHISVIEDIKTIFNSLGHSVDSWNLSGHNWVFGRSPANVEVVNQSSWKNLDQKMCDEFYNRYKNDLYKYDAFIACYPPAFALLYERFNKPIYVVVATRYEYPFSNDLERWNWLDNKLKNMIDSGQVIPIANNKYDRYYCGYFLERDFKHIPSLCNYTNAKYVGMKDPIVSGRSSINGFNHIASLGRFTWADLYSHKAIIHIPYNTSVMSIFEQYTANVPLFFPAIEFGKKINGYMSELIFIPNNRISPELLSNSAISLADFYDEDWMPYVQYYDSIDNLIEKINTVDLENVSNQMLEANKIRSKKIINTWGSVLC